jgi:branched-chain amino acid transport system substrate-binding protein
MVAWNAFMDRYLPQGDKKSSYHVYGYAVSSTLVDVLKRCGDELTRANIMNQAAHLRDLEVPLLLPNIKINTDASNFYPIQSVRLQRFKGETWEYSLAAWLSFATKEAAGEGAGAASKTPALPQVKQMGE